MKALLLYMLILMSGCSVIGMYRIDLLNSDEVKMVSMDYVLEHPNALDGKAIEVRGFLTMNFEGNTLCEDSHDKFERCLRVFFSRSDSKSEGLQKDGLIGLVSVRGIFKMEDLDNEHARQTDGGIVVQFGPYWHSMERSFLMNGP